MLIVHVNITCFSLHMLIFSVDHCTRYPYLLLTEHATIPCWSLHLFVFLVGHYTYQHFLLLTAHVNFPSLLIANDNIHWCCVITWILSGVPSRTSYWLKNIYCVCGLLEKMSRATNTEVDQHIPDIRTHWAWQFMRQHNCQATACLFGRQWWPRHLSGRLWWFWWCKMRHI